MGQMPTDNSQLVRFMRRNKQEIFFALFVLAFLGMFLVRGFDPHYDIVCDGKPVEVHVQGKQKLEDIITQAAIARGIDPRGITNIMPAISQPGVEPASNGVNTVCFEDGGSRVARVNHITIVT